MKLLTRSLHECRAKAPDTTATAFCLLPTAYCFLGSKASAILTGIDESLNHVSVDEVAIELIQLRQPEVVATVVGVLWVVRISSQVAKVLHQHKRFIFLLLIQS